MMLPAGGRCRGRRCGSLLRAQGGCFGSRVAAATSRRRLSRPSRWVRNMASRDASVSLAWEKSRPSRRIWSTTACCSARWVSSSWTCRSASARFSSSCWRRSMRLTVHLTVTSRSRGRAQAAAASLEHPLNAADADLKRACDLEFTEALIPQLADLRFDAVAQWLALGQGLRARACG
jgi:hypothetical protein